MMSPEPAGTTSFINREFAHYRITKLLGRGGMGEVYLAQDTRLSRQVAIKFLPAVLGDDGSRVRRFEQEALAASALNHPNILTVYEFGAEEGHQFLVTEFVDGRTLRDLLHHSTLALADVLRIAEQTALALSLAPPGLRQMSRTPSSLTERFSESRLLERFVTRPEPRLLIRSCQ